MKRTTLLPALCLLLAILSGCGSQPAETTQPVQTQPHQTEPVVETTQPATEPMDGTEHFRLQLPEGFVLSEESEDRWVYLSPDAPEDPSYITVELAPSQPEVLTMSASDYKKQLDVTKTGESDALRFKLIDIWTERVAGYTTVASEFNLVYADYITHAFRYEVVTDYANLILTLSDATDNNLWLTQFTSCAASLEITLSGGMSLDFTDLTLYELDCGVQLYAQPSLVEHDAAGFSACLGNRNAIILLMSDDKETNHLTGMDLEDYAQLLRTTNGLDKFQRDELDNLYTTFYTTTEDGTSYFNMLFVKDIGDHFWVCQMACTAEVQELYQSQFSLWASSITD